jgi:hypothetical protein
LHAENWGYIRGTASGLQPITGSHEVLGVVVGSWGGVRCDWVGVIDRNNWKGTVRM